MNQESSVVSLTFESPHLVVRVKAKQDDPDSIGCALAELLSDLLHHVRPAREIEILARVVVSCSDWEDESEYQDEVDFADAARRVCHAWDGRDNTLLAEAATMKAARNKKASAGDLP